MESGGKGEEDGGFNVFRDGELVELLGAGGLGGVGELLEMEEEEDVEQKVRVAGGETVGVDGFLLRCSPAAAAAAYPLATSSSPTSSSYRMLCFGGDEGGFTRERTDGFPQKSSASGNESCSSTSSSSSNSSLSKLKKKAAETRGFSDAADRGRTSTTTTTTTTTTKTTATTKSAGAASKKPRKEPPQPRPVSQGRTLKVRKENLGDRISALQQLVSPFGKSDTASVLHEALGYIRFLHNQVQVLSSPYLQQQLPPSGHLHGGGGGELGMPRGHDLRSRGLCLVPVACTMNVAGSNGADFWSPAMESGGVDCHQPEVSDR